jgi:hypothetical protein
LPRFTATSFEDFAISPIKFRRQKNRNHQLL